MKNQPGSDFRSPKNLPILWAARSGAKALTAKAQHSLLSSQSTPIRLCKLSFPRWLESLFALSPLLQNSKSPTNLCSRDSLNKQTCQVFKTWQVSYNLTNLIYVELRRIELLTS